MGTLEARAHLEQAPSTKDTCLPPLTDWPLVLQGQIKVAKRRIVMASLYLGTGPLEQELVSLPVPGSP